MCSRPISSPVSLHPSGRTKAHRVAKHPIPIERMGNRFLQALPFNSVQKHFLLVEDSDSDAVLLRRSLVRSCLTNPVHAVHSGEAAIEYLTRIDKYAKKLKFSLPSVIFLDLHLPGMDGFEVLKWIRARPELASTRVVVLTASVNPRDVQTARNLGANSFMIKPIDFEQLAEFRQAIDGCWISSDFDEKPAPPGSGPTTYIVQTRPL